MSWLAGITSLFGQSGAGSGNVGILERELLDEWRIPVGDWAEQAVFWVANNLKDTVLEWINWPFEELIKRLVQASAESGFWYGILTNRSWLWVVLAMMVVAFLVRNLKVAAFVGVALFVCGILGDAYWRETARTIGFVGVAVLLCVIVGIPVGIACGRVDGIWKVVRPVLDAMQVVHSFVYMLPFIFFWGIGEVSATMVTMVFALPPLIRLTNLGIRQVPSDVVEASRAYGASELRVLSDVQIPLARPAIMTGINQTLLLSISMLGIAAIMGAGGLGRLLFQAINNQNVAQAASAGLAFFLVAVVLDRMSQREESDATPFFRRIRLAWAHRKDPEALIPDVDASAVVEHTEADQFAELRDKERLPMITALAGAVLAIIAAFAPWTSNAGKMSAFGRWRDASLQGELTGMTFSGLDAAGGSWFGVVVLIMGGFLVLAVIVSWIRPGRGPRWLAADGAVIAAVAIAVVSLSHLLAPHIGLAAVEGAPSPGTGWGVYLAILAGLLASAGAITWLWVAPHSPLRPLPSQIAWGRLVGTGIAILTLVVALFSGWGFDEREQEVITPELQAQMDELERRADESEGDPAAIAAELLVLRAQATRSGRVVTDGLTRNGPQLGVWALIVGLMGVATSLWSAGLFGRNEALIWRWSTLTAALGFGAAMIGFAWIFTHVRSADFNYVSGVGSFLAMLGGMFMVSATMSVLREFRRSKVYDDAEAVAEDSIEPKMATKEAVAQLV